GRQRARPGEARAGPRARAGRARPRRRRPPRAPMGMIPLVGRFVDRLLPRGRGLDATSDPFGPPLPDPGRLARLDAIRDAPAGWPRARGAWAKARAGPWSRRTTGAWSAG